MCYNAETQTFSPTKRTLYGLPNTSGHDVQMTYCQVSLACLSRTCLISISTFYGVLITCTDARFYISFYANLVLVNDHNDKKYSDPWVFGESFTCMSL